VLDSAHSAAVRVVITHLARLRSSELDQASRQTDGLMLAAGSWQRRSFYAVASNRIGDGGAVVLAYGAHGVTSGGDGSGRVWWGKVYMFVYSNASVYSCVLRNHFVCIINGKLIFNRSGFLALFWVIKFNSLELYRTKNRIIISRQK
jgi:hypothetical protein